jgi:DHA1 family multidrug resistance protein-like MFS transporter
MADIIRDSSLGQLIRYATSNRYLQYVEERPGFELPTPVEEPAKEKLEEDRNNSDSDSSSETDVDLERAATVATTATRDLRPYFSRTTQREAVGPQRTVSRPIQPTLTSDGTILVDWYSTGELGDFGVRRSVADDLQMTPKTL